MLMGLEAYGGSLARDSVLPEKMIVKRRRNEIVTVVCGLALRVDGLLASLSMAALLC
jgi:hypothetical protein